MALELVGGAVLSSFLQLAFDRLASPNIQDYFRGRKLTETLLKRLKVTLLVIDAVIDDAENKQIRNPKIKAWVDEVKDAAYEAEDLLDEIDIKVSKRKQQENEGRTRYAKRVRKLFNSSVTLFDREIKSRMKQVLDNLEYLEKQKDILGLRDGSGVGDSVRSAKMSERSETTSLVDKSEICGRTYEKEEIVKWLLSDVEMGTDSYSVISIVAMGGMGKTTLAQLVYNDERIESKFDVKAWVWVSKDFDVVKVTRTILEAFTLSSDQNNSSNDNTNKNMLQLKLKEKLVGKRFFLVLDNVWNENYLKWEDLQKPFNEVAKGSKIFVTSRNRKVAETMRSQKIIPLEELPEDDSWLLFSKHAFHGRNPDSYPSLEETGRKIVKKCKGLPLALKTIGSLLYSKASYEEWNIVLTSEIWDMSDLESDILPALRLSYCSLSSNLKRCFAYCSLFPKGWKFVKEDLVWLWIGENLLPCSQYNKSVKEVGDYYFYELLSRSFFQYSSREKIYFMHDLVNDLAKYASGEFCFRMGMEDVVPQTISKKTRHFLFEIYTSTHEDSKWFEPLYNTNKLRTFLHVNSHSTYGVGMVSLKIIEDVLSKFQCLRVLSLSYFGITKLPDSIGKLKHLRYLDLSKTRVIELPDSICLLYNLKILKLRYCRSLIQLPSDLHKLVNLQYLDIKHTGVRKMPKKLGKLKKLEVLTSFSVGNESDIKQLAELQNIGGELSILELQNVVNPMDALAVSLKNKIHLDRLELAWNNDTDEPEKERDVLEKLQPHQNLKVLSVYRYGGTRLPDWFGDSSLQSLVSLELCVCRYCLLLPPLGILPSLKRLHILGLDSIVNIGHEFYGENSSVVPFRSLEVLEFENMKEWEDWECKDISRAFPVLQELSIRECPKLKQKLPEQLPSLRSLSIRNCQQLMASVPHATNIRQLFLQEFGKLQLEYIASSLELLSIIRGEMVASENFKHTISNSCLKVLQIDGCPNMDFPIHHCYEFLIKIDIDSSCESLKTFPLDLFPKLQQLSLKRSSNLEMISLLEEYDHYVASITLLHIEDCPKFVQFPKGGSSAPRLTDLTVINCPQFKLSPEEGLPSNLKSLHITDCPKLTASRMKWGLHIQTSLVTMIIGDADMESFPDEGLLPPSLTYLKLDSFSNLRTLNYQGLHCLFSLRQLSLRNCPRLECLPKEGLPSSLSSLYIDDCPLLSKRCQKQKGEDWEKIAHIDYISTDYDYIINKEVSAKADCS